MFTMIYASSEKEKSIALYMSVVPFVRPSIVVKLVRLENCWQGGRQWLEVDLIWYEVEGQGHSDTKLKHDSDQQTTER